MKKSAKGYILIGAAITFPLVNLIAYVSSCRSEVGAPVPVDVAQSLRGGGGSDSLCCWQKSVECQDTVNSSNGSTCPLQTYYYSDEAEGTEYTKAADSDYCGTQRAGSPGVYDCTSV